MEWSVHVASAGDIAAQLDLRRFRGLSESASKLQPTLSLTFDLIEEYFGTIAFSRCVYGNEFCEHLIPSREKLEEILGAADSAGLPVTFLTPYCSDAGIQALKPLFHLLSLSSGPIEVVFNEWGVLNLLRRDFPELVPVQGRLMNKSLRDPRVTGVYASSEGPGPALVSLRRSNLDCSSYTGFLSGLGIQSVELDNLPQGVDFGFADSGVKASVYFPFGFISTSRICMAAGLQYRKRDKFQPGAPCRHECQSHSLEYSYTNSPFENRDQKFYLKGNTYFYVHTEEMLRLLFQQARAGLIDRLVFQPHLPMWE
jgi:hypothetical protein